MENIHILMAGLTAIILFVFGLQNFPKKLNILRVSVFDGSLEN